MNKHSNLTNDSLLIGVLIDVSLSMKENWKQEKVKIPTIEVIRDAINKEINTYKKLHSDKLENENNIEIFSFGFGFKSFESGILIDNENKKGKSKEISNTIEKHDTICDILALNEMIPTSD